MSKRKRDTTARRILNRNGSFNVRKHRRRQAPWQDTYHSVLTMPWWRFTLVTLGFYLSINFLFASLYWLAGPDALEGTHQTSLHAHFWDCFFFSVQTFSTIGYGKMSPNGIMANLLVTLEALVGMSSVALATGILFSRFSRPTARVVFSRVVLIAPHDGKKSLIFRLANERLNQIVDAQITVNLLLKVVTKEGQYFRVPYELKLDRARTPVFALSWTVLHTIDESSPLFNKTREDLEALDAEIIVSLVGIDDTFSTNISSRFSYVAQDIVYDARFDDMLLRAHDGVLVVHLDKIHHTVPLASAKADAP